MEKIKLFDGTILDIEMFASLPNVVHVAKSSAKARQAAALFTSENLRHVEFLEGDRVNGVFNNLALIAEEGMENPIIDGNRVTVSLYQA